MSINTKKCLDLGTENPRVRGSIPRLGTIFFPTLSNTSSTPHAVWVEQLLLKNKSHLIGFVLRMTMEVY